MTATPFNATPFKKNDPTKVGTATLAFANGNSATFQYTIGSNGTITKQLTHEALAPGGTVCNYPFGNDDYARAAARPRSVPSGATAI